MAFERKEKYFIIYNWQWGNVVVKDGIIARLKISIKNHGDMKIKGS